METIYLAGGCFWGIQKYLDQFNGITETETGYANGRTVNPTYRDVCGGSGHAETVRTVFDENVLPLEKLLDLYFEVIDPLSVNRQGGDSGVQYRTGIYYTDDVLIPEIFGSAKKLEEKLGQPLAVEIKRLENYYPAEEYHQKYLDKNPGGYCHIPVAFFNRSRADGISYREFGSELMERVEEIYQEEGWNAYLGDSGKLRRAFEKSIYVLGAFSGESLVGLARCVGDGEHVVLLQDLIVDRKHRRQGIGRELVRRVREKYDGVRMLLVVTDMEDEADNAFYRNMGMELIAKGNMAAYYRP